jgi:hypothetical protein
VAGCRSSPESSVSPTADQSLRWDQLPRHGVATNLFEAVKEIESHGRETVKIAIAVHLCKPLAKPSYPWLDPGILRSLECKHCIPAS